MKSCFQTLAFKAFTFISFTISALAGSQLLAEDGVPFSAGNIVVSGGSRIFEFTLAGELIQQIDVPTVDDSGGARDIVVSPNGKLYAFNGTFDPRLSTYDPATNEWTHKEIEGWAIVNNGSYGGVGLWKDKIFLTDMIRGETDGVIAFDTKTETVEQFANGIEPIDLTIGFDGFVYILSPGGSPEGRFIHVYNPANLSFVRRIALTEIFGHTGHRSIAVDRDSNIYLATWDGQLRKINKQGELIAETTLRPDGFPPNLNDINIDGLGNVVASDRFGRCYVTDPEFSHAFEFLGVSFERNAFSTFVTQANETTRHAGDYFGSDANDDFVVDLDRDTVTLNGTEMPIHEDAGRIRFFGGEGYDSIEYFGKTDLAEYAILGLGSGRMSVIADSVVMTGFQSESMEFVGSDPSDAAVLVDSFEDDQLSTSPDRSELSSGERLVIASDVANVYAVSLDGEDSAVYQGSVESEQFYIDLSEKEVRAFSGTSLVEIRGFNSLFANAFQEGNDQVVLFGSEETEYVYSKADFTTVYNSNFDYTFRGFERFDMYSTPGSYDRARFVQTPGSIIRDRNNWNQLVGPGFRTSVFDFRRIDVTETEE